MSPRSQPARTRSSSRSRKEGNLQDTDGGDDTPSPSEATPAETAQGIPTEGTNAAAEQSAAQSPADEGPSQGPSDTTGVEHPPQPNEDPAVSGGQGEPALGSEQLAASSVQDGIPEANNPSLAPVAPPAEPSAADDEELRYLTESLAEAQEAMGMAQANARAAGDLRRDAQAEGTLSETAEGRASVAATKRVHLQAVTAAHERQQEVDDLRAHIRIAERRIKYQRGGFDYQMDGLDGLKGSIGPSHQRASSQDPRPITHCDQ